MIHTTAVPYGRTGQGRGPWIHTVHQYPVVILHVVDGYSIMTQISQV